MRQVWLDPEVIQGSAFLIRDEAYHHLFSVMRLKAGEEFEAISGRSEAVKLKIQNVGKKEAQVEVVSRRALRTMPNPKIGVVWAVPKFTTFDENLEKLVELGASYVQPLITERSFLQKKTDVSDARKERWRKIVQSATAQSQRAELLEILEPKTVDEFSRLMTNRAANVACLMAYEGSHAELGPQLKALKGQPIETLWFIIGPEGGFTTQEVETFEKSRVPNVSLGDLVLKSETACFTLISILKYEFEIVR